MTFVELTEHKHAETVGQDASSLLGTVRGSISRLADPARGGGGCWPRHHLPLSHHFLSQGGDPHRQPP